MIARPYISILVSVHNQTELLRELLRSIFENTSTGTTYEVIVCDDGSDTPVVSNTAPEPRLRIVRHGSALGAASGRNSAARLALGEVFLFLDADTVLKAGSIEHLSARFNGETDLGALNGGAEVSAANHDGGFTPQYRAMIDHVQQNLRNLEACSWFTARCGAIRRSVFFAAGGFDEFYQGASVEEIEFGHRLSVLTPIRFDSGLSVSHHYARFWKNTNNYFTRTRYWAGLFASRRRFENYGSATGHAGFGSILALVWIPGLLFPFPVQYLSCVVSIAGLYWGYHDIFRWSLRLKGPKFFFQTVLLTWWLCVPVVAGAGFGFLDYLRTGQSSARKLGL